MMYLNTCLYQMPILISYSLPHFVDFESVFLFHFPFLNLLNRMCDFVFFSLLIRISLQADLLAIVWNDNQILFHFTNVSINETFIIVI